MPAQVWAQRDADGGDEAERRAAFLEICSAETRFRAWYERALPRVYGFVFGRTGGDATVADEITQHAFVAAIRHHATFDGRSDPVVWVCSIARNALIDHHRRRARDARRHLSLMEREISIDGDAKVWQRLDDRDEILGVLAALTPDQRSAVFLHYIDGLPIRDVAGAIGRSEAATESLLSRARDRLRALVAEGRT